MKIIVIGSIAAGVSAAERISRRQAGSDIIIYDRGRFYSCGLFGLPHYLNESLDKLKAALLYKNEEIKRRSITSFLRHEVTAIDAEKQVISIHDLKEDILKEDHYDKLVLATGYGTLIPDLPGHDRIGVQTLKNVEDLLFLKEYLKTPYVRDIVILGGDYYGIEVAKALMKMGRNVRIIEKKASLLSGFDKEVTDSIKKELEKQGLIINLNEKVTEFPGKTFIESVKTNRGNYDCDLCICTENYEDSLCIELTQKINTDKNGRIIINKDLETNLKNIYAIGGCAILKDSLGTTISLRTHDFEVAKTGITEDEARQKGLRIKSVTASAPDRPGIVPDPNKITIKLIYEPASLKILGAQAWGKKNVSSRINAISVAIEGGMSTEDLAKTDMVFSSGTFSIWDPVQIVCDLAHS